MAFLVFEGIDGSGKSTLMGGLCAELDQRGVSYITTREPGGTPLAEKIRNLLLSKEEEVPHPRTELLLYQASRAQHVEGVIKPAMSDNKWVICDRYTSSTLAFQAGGRDLAEGPINWLNDYSTDALKPDYFVLLDLTVEESEARRSNREKTSGVEADRFESEKSEFHQKVRNHYLKQTKEDPDRWIVLDASHTPEQLREELLSELKSKGVLS